MMLCEMLRACGISQGLDRSSEQIDRTREINDAAAAAVQACVRAHVCMRMHTCFVRICMSICVCVSCVYWRHRVFKLLEPQGVFQAAVSYRQWIYVLGMLHATQVPGEAVEMHWLVLEEEANLMVADQLRPEGVALRPSSGVLSLLGPDSL